ncbi:MAG: alpha/beta family hydrolase [Ornithinibacter sp.]
MTTRSDDALVDTPEGPARVLVSGAGTGSVGMLVLGHGAGGTRWTEDVTAVRDAAVGAGWVVVLLDQPWRVAGRRIATRPESLDRAWLSVLAHLGRPAGPLVVGGRSAGARVACRTAAQVGASAVLALSFPLHPPGRPDRSRADELAAPSLSGIPVHVIQGRADPMGTPEEVAAVLPASASVHPVEGNHSLERAAKEVACSALQGLQGSARGVGSP